MRNAAAHSLAVHRLRQHNSTGFDDDMTEPTSIVALYNGSPLTRGLPQQVAVDAHFTALKTKLQKDNNWDESTFNRVDWNNYHRAIISLPRTKRLSISKLSHRLWNTNEQNSKFYQQDSKCPYCPQVETQDHIFCCTSVAATEVHQEALATLQCTLQKAGTPTPLMDLIIALLPPHARQISKPYATSLAQDQLSIGPYCLHRGFLCVSWRTSYLSAIPITTKRRLERADTWTKQAILALWAYSSTLWKARNAVVHGQTTLQADSKSIKLLKEGVKRHYLNYSRDPHTIPASRAHLFDKPIEVLQQWPKQQLKCWIASVEEALATKSCRDQENSISMKAIMAQFLRPREKVLRRAPPTNQLMTKPPVSLKPTTKKKSQHIKRLPYRAPFRPHCTVTPLPSSRYSEALPPPAFPISRSSRNTKSPSASQTLSKSDIALFATPPGMQRVLRKGTLILRKSQQTLLKRKPEAVNSRTRPSRAREKDDRNQTRLISFGFKPKISKSQRDREAIKQDYSGSFISTTP